MDRWTILLLVYTHTKWMQWTVYCNIDTATAAAAFVMTSVRLNTQRTTTLQMQIHNVWGEENKNDKKYFDRIFAWQMPHNNLLRCTNIYTLRIQLRQTHNGLLHTNTNYYKYSLYLRSDRRDRWRDSDNNYRKCRESKIIIHHKLVNNLSIVIGWTWTLGQFENIFSLFCFFNL